MLDPRRFFSLAALGVVSRSPGKIYLSVPSTTRRTGFLRKICDRFTTIPLRCLAWVAAKLVILGSDQTERTPGANAPGVSYFRDISRVADIGDSVTKRKMQRIGSKQNLVPAIRFGNPYNMP